MRFTKGIYTCIMFMLIIIEILFGIYTKSIFAFVGAGFLGGLWLSCIMWWVLYDLENKNG